MKISVKGLTRSPEDHLRRKLTKELIEFVVDRFVSNGVKRKVFVEVAYNDYDISDCIWEDDNHRPREFSVNLSKNQNILDQLSNIAHEAVHIKQWVNGELVTGMGPNTHGRMKWHGEWTDYHLKSKNPKDYWESPWEIEAYGRERGLVVMFLHEKGIKEHDMREEWFNSLDENFLKKLLD